MKELALYDYNTGKIRNEDCMRSDRHREIPAAPYFDYSPDRTYTPRMSRNFGHNGAPEEMQKLSDFTEK